jgi:CubicO group peptidase (beta-lactamase class C family)
VSRAAEAILRLAATGAIDLDEPMSKHWVDLDIAEHRWHQLLTPRVEPHPPDRIHQLALPDRERADVPMGTWYPDRQLRRRLRLRGRFAERKVGHDFESLVQEHVFDPIGMNDTSFTHRAWHEGIPIDCCPSRSD